MSTYTEDSEAISDEEQEELLQEVERRRSVRGPAAVAVAFVGFAFSAFQVWLAARGFTFDVTLPLVGEVGFGQLQSLQLHAIHVTFALVLTFLLFPPTRGDGRIVRSLGRIPPVVRSRFGEDSSFTSGIERVRGGARWFALDASMDRVTPLDLVLIVLSIWPTYYIVTSFDSVRRMAVRGLAGMPPIQEVYPATAPVVGALAAVGVPIDELSYGFLLAVLGILLVLEATRRTLGLFLATLVSLFIVYARWGYLVPRDSVLGQLSIPPLEWSQIVYNLWYTTESGIFGTPVSVSVRFIYIFILFGAFLEMSGAGQWFIDLAYSLTGTRRGGPAKASVVSSGFMGMLSGSSVANTVTTGAFTIPLMKRSGYSPEFSGGVESSASSGGQVLPPVMGAAAFLIVEFTGTPYPDVIVAATLPAIAFFFGMWIMVHFEAVRRGIGGLDRADLPPVVSHLRRGWFYLLPLITLLYFLIGLRLSINRAGWYTIVTVVALIAFIAAYDEDTRVPLIGTVLALFLAQTVSYAAYGVGAVDGLLVAAGTAPSAVPLPIGAAVTTAVGSLGTITVLVSAAFLLARPFHDAPLLELDEAVDAAAETGANAVDRPDLATNPAVRFGGFLFTSMVAGARTATTVVIAVAAAGVIPGVISVSGLGPNLTSMIVSVSGESFLVLLLLSGVAAIVFGLGMPTTVMYIILVTLLGNALEVFGTLTLAAHIYVLYFGLMADVTPPVAVAAFAAAGVAKADEFKTATTAFLLSLNKIMVPFAFVFTPGILLLRRDGEEVRVLGLADVLDVGWFLPEVVVPVLGMFLGVYALSATIIGYQFTKVDGIERALFAISSILLMVPDMPLLFVEDVLALFGIPSALRLFTITFPLRVIGLLLLLGLSKLNREQAGPATGSADSSAVAGDA